MKNLATYTLITAVLAVGSACTKLDENLQDKYTQQFSPNNSPVGAKNNVNKPQPNDGLQGAFSALLSGTATNGGFFAVNEGGTDEAVITQKGGDWYDGGLYIKIHHHEFSPQTWAINDTWTQAYNGVFQCNTLLATTTDPANKAQLTFLRAYFLWRLYDVFGNIKLPTVAGTDVAQSTRLQAFNHIEAQLLAAIPNLPDGRQSYGRVSKSAAYGLLSRMYLNAEAQIGTPRYDDAILYSKKIMDEGFYSLSKNYADCFSPANVDDPEHIFVAPFDESTGTGENWAQMTLHYPSQLTFKLQQQPWNGFSTLEDFYNSYDAADLRKKANFIVGPQVDLAGNPILDLAYDKADPDGAPINYTPKINELFPNGSRQAGARFGKFSFKLGQHPDMDNDFPLIRYGEIVLNFAEASFRKNGYGDAAGLAAINQLRTRAGVPVYTTLTAGELLTERGRELFVEAQRRDDLIRFGAYNNAWWEHAADADATHHLNLMAIPIEQMNASLTSPFPLTQNPGY